LKESRISMLMYFSHNVWLKYWIAMKLVVLER
jgi:hypothetical protein